MKIYVVVLFLFFCVSCNSTTALKKTPETTQLQISSTNQQIPSKTIEPTRTITNTPKPTNTSIPTRTPTRLPWSPLGKELSFGDWYLKCEVSGVSFDVIEILPGIEVTGSFYCSGYQIPAGIFDRTNNVLYYWGLYPLENPEITDSLGERGIERFLTVFGLGETYLDSKNLIGRQISMTINLPNNSNRAIFDTQNIGRFAIDFWKNQETVDRFAKTGVLPNNSNILYPIALGVIK